MEQEIFEVTRDDYVCFLDQIRKDMITTEMDSTEQYNIIKVISKNTNTVLCARYIPINDDQETHFYVFTYPEDNELQAPISRRKIVLETREEVQAFFDILAKIQKGDIKND